MVQDELESLEVRVKKIIDVVKRLKEERSQLIEQLRGLDQRLAQREKEYVQLEVERKRARSKVERLLGKLSLIE
jgi:predicted  nucleic acid-binding Zn-ribbon protein